MSTENEKKGFALGKRNFILMAISLSLIVIGFILMTGKPSEEVFNPDIFSTRRITFGPMISFIGFLFMIVAILWKPKQNQD
jgi:uncharacterized membrane protein